MANFTSEVHLYYSESQFVSLIFDAAYCKYLI